MKAALDIVERLFEKVSQTFLVRAVLPWAFVLLIDLGLYEFLIPDSRSLVGAFLPLPDHSMLALLGLAAWIFAAALSSDSIASRIISSFRQDSAPFVDPLEAIELPFDVASWWTRAAVEFVSNDERREALSEKIAEKLNTTHRNANIAAALAASLWSTIFGIPADPGSGELSLAIVLVLSGLTTGALYLARQDLDDLIALDRIWRRLSDALLKDIQAKPSPEGPLAISTVAVGTSASHQLRARSVRLFGAAAIVTLLFAGILVALHNPGILVRRPAPSETVQESGKKEKDKEKTEHLTVLAVNDIYRLEGVAGGERGGLPRLRTLRKQLEAEGREVIVTHAGDFLAPSLASQIFKGRQMIDVMNHLDGNGALLDRGMFVAFGNHEFDDSKCRGTPVLATRVAESQFRWLNSNLDFSGCGPLRAISEASNVDDFFVYQVGRIKVGLFGIGLTPDRMEELSSGNALERKSPPDYPVSEPEIAVAERSIARLRAKGANYIIAVTHLPQQQDQELLDKLGSKGLDLIVGGHDHDCMELQANGASAFGFKADSDARTAWRIDLDFLPAGRLELNAQLVDLDQSVPRDEDVLRRAVQWTSWAEAKICEKTRKSDNPACLDERIGRTNAPIELEESANRSRETGFGDWLADRVRDKTKAEVVMINSGSLGLNENLAAHSELHVRQMVDIFRYDGIIATQDYSAQQVCDALKHGFSKPGSGAWPHISGVKVEINGSEAGNLVSVVGLDCKRSDKKITVAGLPFLLCGNDGYDAFKPNAEKSDECVDRLTKAGDANGLLSEIAEKAITSAEPAGIDPQPDGRVKLPMAQATDRACTRRVSAHSQYR